MGFHVCRPATWQVNLGESHDYECRNGRTRNPSVFPGTDEFAPTQTFVKPRGTTHRGRFVATFHADDRAGATTAEVVVSTSVNLRIETESP